MREWKPIVRLSRADPHWLALSALFLQHVSFFALGNSNSLSSIDLSNAYNGVTAYSIPFVGALMFISNWAGPIWWSAATLSFLIPAKSKVLATSQAPRKTKETEGPTSAGMLWWFLETSLLHGIVIVFLVGSCIILWTHLFIWTVFSPKFLFQAVWVGLAHILVEGLVGAVVCFIG
jgi:ethanolamine phosphate transferase 2 subunit G